MPSGMTYYESVHKPWGRMFYDLAYLQLDVPESPRLRILDFGSGYGLCANHYAQWHDVTAIEPDGEMIAQRFHTNMYTQIHGDVADLRQFTNEFDLVICHNVLEYVQDKEEIICALAGAVKPGGKLSIVKHNINGRVMARAVFDNDPAMAMALLNDLASDQSTTFGDRFLYENQDLLGWADKLGLEIDGHYGIRAFFALTQNNEIKHCPKWYEKMMALEKRVGDVDAFRQVAFLNHFIFRK